MIRVLIVDDEAQIRRALSLNLGARGYEVFEASSGELALTAAANTHPDIVLLDLGLLGMDGVMVLEALRGWTKVKLLPAILAGREVWKWLGIRRQGPANIVFGIEGLNAANELCDGVLDPRLVDRRGAENEVKEHWIFLSRGEPRDEIGEIRITIGPAEPHLDRILDRLGDLIFERGRVFIPKELNLSAEPRIR